MALLLDTHALIWFLSGDERLPLRARRAIEEQDEVAVSAASAVEITTKHRIGKLPEAGELALAFESTLAIYGFLPLSISVAHSALAGSLRGSHKDPFDRLLMAQAIIENLALVSNEQVFDNFGVRRLW